MKLRMKNFAKVKEADIVINGITVIAGENNMGKSTIGKVLYCLYSVFNNLESKVILDKTKGIFGRLMNKISFDVDELNELWKVCEILIGFSGSIEELKEILLANNISIEDDSVLNDILVYTNFDSKQLENLVLERQFKIEFNNQFLPMDLDNESSPSEIELNIQNEKIQIGFLNGKPCINSKMKLYKKGIYIDNPFLLNHMNSSSYRRSKMKRDIVNTVFLNDNMDHEDELLLTLSKTLKNNGDTLIDEAINRQRKEKFLQIIRNTIGGDFLEKEDKFIFLDNNKLELEISNLSTGIKSFAIILKLLENNDIGNKSIIILDEPEVHLHPNWQLIYANLLVLLQKEYELNIVLTSHSPYFINAIEVFSAKYEIADKCKYYLALPDNQKVVFEDVTTNIDKIYEKLNQSLITLEDVL